MGYLGLLLFILCLGIWQISVLVAENRDKLRKYEAALNFARKQGKPLLIAGGPWGAQPLRHLLHIAAHGSGDVCLDIDRRAIGLHPNGVVADITRAPFTDKSFGAAFASHLLEHLPDIGEARKALEEMNRIADAVYIAYPSGQSVANWFMRGHHIWVWQKNNTTYLKQRGNGGAVGWVELPQAETLLQILNKENNLKQEAYQAGQKLFGKNIKKCEAFTQRLIDIYTKVQGMDILVVHNPGGWGNTNEEHCIDWEKSIINGIRATLTESGYHWLFIQHFRTGRHWWEKISDTWDQFHFFASKAKILAAELEFITEHTSNLKVVMVGISQGAAFGNAVMQQLGGLPQVYSIEPGIFSLRKLRRVITDNTLAVDSNGLMPDAVVEQKKLIMLKACLGAPFRWLKYRLQGHPKQFSFCVNVPGHEYFWEYPEVQSKIIKFLELKLGVKSKLEVRLP